MTLDFKTSGKKWALLVIRGIGARPFCGSVVVVNGEERVGCFALTVLTDFL